MLNVDVYVVITLLQKVHIPGAVSTLQSSGLWRRAIWLVGIILSEETVSSTVRI
jgi:type II secretory pathway component PulL